MSKERPRTSQAGITLLELMVALTVLSILLTIAVPSFRSAAASSAVRSATSDLVTSLAQTRSTAAKTGRRATMCVSSNGIQCTTAGTWEQGWIVFSDPNHSGVTANIDAGDTINFLFPPIQNQIVIIGANGLTRYISYGPDGQAKTNTGAALMGKIRVCSKSTAIENNSRARDLTINFAGRVTVNTPVVDATCPAPT
ncbi:GspH/FimT family pseudopilin [Rhodoferax aquaticus]|uniref:Type II secretion system protein H n=1 Tax=Rhodoferax aquaticus TaxID=2527691 RepID=A0A515ENM9_9BURK|nr:GspH/FimT family pseudopilin [Rhodoferax aquaticus]QDL54238.1 prepilin-type N-terminal cleavage/methylation domain-containing protein [Rhodoferax aquaticus]